MAEYDVAIDVLRTIPASTVAVENDGESEPCFYARRGIFVFDSDHCGGVYSRIYAPKQPVNVAALPQVVAIAAGHVTFEAASFETSATLDQRHIDALQQSSDQYVPVAVISKLICVAASVA